MKIVVLGDIHGRLIWGDIIAEENPDRVIFLGDYVATHGDISAEQQLSNLEDILNYKEENPDKVTLLRGNHDTQHLGYYWAQCSGWDGKVWGTMSQTEFKNRFLNLTQWMYIDDDLKTIFSHAGVSKVWLKSVEKHIISKCGSQYDDGTIDEEVLLTLINNIEPCELFGFTPNWRGDYYGNSTTQPLTWIRPESLRDCNVEGWNQVVGHTPVKRQIIDFGSIVGTKEHIWLCDALGINQYLVIDNGTFQPKTLKL